MHEIDVEFRAADGTRLVGILNDPPGMPIGWALLVHGITVEKNEGGFYTELAAKLAEANFGTLRFDFRGHGESGGLPEDMTIAGEQDDLGAAVKFVRTRGAGRVGIVGTSFGASIAVLYASQYTSEVGSLALLCPVLDYRRTFLEPETEWAREWFTPEAIDGAQQKGTLNLDGYLLGRQLLEEFRTLDPAAALRRLNLPTLLLHGTEDSMVPYEVSRLVAESCKHIRFLPVRNADHGFEGAEANVYSEVCTWLTRHLVA